MNPWFLAMMVGGAVIPMFAPTHNRPLARRIFWTGVVIAVIGGFFAAYPPDWRTGLGLALLAGGVMLLRAYFTTPYLKLGGKIYAFNVADSRPDPDRGEKSSGNAVDRAPDSYGGMVTATRSWWLLVPVAALTAVIIGGYVAGGSKPSSWLALVMVGVLLVLAVSRGHEDGSWGYPIARGQRLQFSIIAVITAGFFAVLYLPAYYAGRRWPWRSQRSMEYRAHPRHWE